MSQTLNAPTQTAEPFARRWEAASIERTSLALGVQPSPKWLSAWGLPDTAAGAEAFCATLLEGAVPRVAAVKVQTPFFERFGSSGHSLLASFIRECRDAGTLVIADAKRGDADDTMPSIADTYLGSDSAVGADALTAVAYMGFEAIAPLCAIAAARACAIFVMVRTSNHAAESVQAARTPDGVSVAQALAGEVTRTNRVIAPQESVGPVSAVVGAPPREARDLVDRMSNALVSLPGLGRPNRSVEEMVSAAGDAYPRTMFPITSGVLQAGPRDLTKTIERWKRDLASAYDPL